MSSKVELAYKVKKYCSEFGEKEDSVRYFQAYVDLETVDYYFKYRKRADKIIKEIELPDCFTPISKKGVSRSEFVKICIEQFIENNPIEEDL